MSEGQPAGWQSPVRKPVYSFPCDAAEAEAGLHYPACLAKHPACTESLGACFDRPSALTETTSAPVDHQLPSGFCPVLTKPSLLDPLCTFEAALCPSAATFIAATSPSGPSTPPRPDTFPHSPLAAWHSVPIPNTASLPRRPRAAATGPPSAPLVKRPRSPASPASSLKRPTSPAHSAMHGAPHSNPHPHPRAPALLVRRSSPAATPHCTAFAGPTPSSPPPIATTSTSQSSPPPHPPVSPPSTPPATCLAPSTPAHHPHDEPPQRPSTPAAPSTSQPPHHDPTTHPHPTSYDHTITRPSPLIPVTPQFLDPSSRILLSVPDALLKEVIKVPLANAADKFLYSVVPSSPDVLPVYSLGAGAFGTVKLVYVETPAPAQELRMCAVKSVIPSCSYSQEDFWKEVEVMEACRGCPYVLHLFSAHVANGVCHLLMEVAGNGCLRDLLWAASTYDEAGLPVRGFSEEAARYLVAGLLVALQHLHSLHIAHLDIKPENVLLDADFRAKLADFGVTRCLRGQPTPTDIVGTPGYQPPEMLNGHGYGVAADMWAVGMVAYQLVAGDLPEEWVVELLLNKGIFRPPAGLSQDLEDLLLQLLAGDPTRRLTAAQARAHPWFDGFDWAAFLAGTMPRPSIPIYHRMPDQRPDSA